jgi:hypothetical protein
VHSLADRPLFEFELAEARLVDGKLELAGTVRPAGRAPAQRGLLRATLVGTMAKEISPEYSAARARRNAARSGATRPSSAEPAKQQPGGAATSTESAGELGQLAQSTQSTARSTPAAAGAEGEKPKERDSPKAADSGIGGCDVVYLRLEVPQRFAAAAGGRSVQLNVSLAQIDNETGRRLNRRICRVVNALDEDDDSTVAEVAELNRMLAGVK